MGNEKFGDDGTPGSAFETRGKMDVRIAEIVLSAWERAAAVLLEETEKKIRGLGLPQADLENALMNAACEFAARGLLNAMARVMENRPAYGAGGSWNVAVTDAQQRAVEMIKEIDRGLKANELINGKPAGHA